MTVSSDVDTKGGMSVESEDCGITTLPQATLHYVQVLGPGQYVCDNSCLQWKSSQICAHTVAVSEKNGDLQSFLDWYVATKQKPNYTSLAIHGLPAGCGRKGGVPKRQRSKAQPRAEISVLRPATCSSVSDKVGSPIVQSSQDHSLSHPSIASYSNTRSESLPTGIGSSYLPQSPLSISQPSAVPYGSVQSASCLTSVGSSAPVVTQNQTINIHPSFPGPSSSRSAQTYSGNPFFLWFIYTRKHKNVPGLPYVIAYSGW